MKRGATRLFSASILSTALYITLAGYGERLTQNRDKLQVEFEAGKNSIIGQGTYGSVHKAKDVLTGNSVALKVVRKNAKSLTHEVNALKKVKELGGHPNVVPLLGVVEIEDDPTKIGLVFELLKGGELYESLIQHGAYSESKAASVVRQVASALAFLHDECHLVHADLKPENLLFKDETFPSEKEVGQLVLVDFGSSVELDADGRHFPLSPQRLLGTVAYAAPELLKGPPSLNPSNSFFQSPRLQKASQAVDVWSLGVILYVVLSGVYPFDPDNELNTDEELARAIVKGDFEFQGSAWNSVSKSAKNLIKRMLIKDPEKRITAREILKHDWVCLPQEEKIISGSDVRLYGFLRTQKRLQDHVFHLMVDGSLKSGGRTEFPDPNQETQTLQSVYRKFDIEGKGFITKKDLDRTLSKGTDSEDQNEDDSNTNGNIDEMDKLYYSSLNGLLGCGERVIFQAGELVFKKGSFAECFYFIDRGKVQVFIDENNPSYTLSAGDFFGETALIKNTPRNATIRAGPTGAELIRFTRSDFDRLVAGSDTFKMLDEQVKKRTVEHIKYVYSSLFNDHRTVHIGYNDILLKRGEPSDSMYYIVDGKVDVISASGKIIAQRIEGETVGELGLITGEPRSMDIKCSAPLGCAFKKLDKTDLKRLLEFSPLANAEITRTLKSRASNNNETNGVSGTSSPIAQGSARKTKS